MAEVLTALILEQSRDDLTILTLLPNPLPISIGGVLIVPTPSKTLPKIVTDYNLLTVDEIAALDYGKLVFYLIRIDRSEEKILGERVQSECDAAVARVITEHKERFARTGERIAVIDRGVSEIGIG